MTVPDVKWSCVRGHEIRPMNAIIKLHGRPHGISAVAFYCLVIYLVIAESNLGGSSSSARLGKLFDDEIDELRYNTY